ncbi:MAG TPA: PAS domain S-box protein [Methanoculleus sp.]|nr:PAS domain S-box protein [Methanoculleus sp.]
MGEEHDTPARILRALRFRPKGMTITEVAKQIRATRNSVSRHLEILRIAGKVDVRSVGNAKLYSLAQRVPISAFLCFTKNLILILDSSQRIVQANDQCLKLLCRTKDDLVGLTLAEAALPVVSAPEAIAVIEGLEREQVVTDLRYRSEGRDLFFQMQAIPTTFDDGQTGCTLVLEDITERRRYVRNMEFLARTAMELVDMPAEADIYRYIADTIAGLVPNPRCIVESYDEVRREFICRAVLSERVREELKAIVGREVVGMVFPFQEFVFTAPFFESPSTLRSLREVRFRPHFDEEHHSFYDSCMRQFSPEACDEILRRFHIGKQYTIGLVWQDQLFGMVALYLSPDEVLEDSHAIESFLRQASIAIARRQTEERLRRSEQRFREVIDSSPYAAALIDPAGTTVFINRQFVETFGYTLEDIPTASVWFEKAFPDDHARREAIAARNAAMEQACRGTPRSRTFSVRCRSGEEKAILVRPVELCDGTRYITCDDVTEERLKYRMLLEEIVDLQKQLASPPR